MDKNYIALIIGLASPILVAIGGLITWFLKTRQEELKAVEERALAKRIETYNILLDPYITLFSKETAQKQKDEAIRVVKSKEYRKAAFSLTTFGSDEMVNSYNDMMQAFYKADTQEDPRVLLKKFGGFILSIRKDVNDKKTKLKDWDMLRFMITNLDEMIKK